MSWSAAGALAVALGAPSLAEAQQSGLFPLAPIRRERVPCPLEDPVYRLYREQFYGYHPTCWRRFPAGWGCPSPEAPNAAEAFRQLPRDKPPAELGPDGEPMQGPDAGAPAGPGAPGAAGPGANPPGGDAVPAPGGRNRPNLPPLPGEGERSPFDLDTKPGPAPAGANPLGRPALPGDPTGDPGAPPAGAAPGAGARPGPGAGLTPPAPAEAAPTAAVAPPAAPAANADQSPLLALPDPTVGPSSAVSSPFDPGLPAGAAQAPRRTTMIGSFLNNIGLRRR